MVGFYLLANNKIFSIFFGGKEDLEIEALRS